MNGHLPGVIVTRVSPAGAAAATEMRHKETKVPVPAGEGRTGDPKPGDQEVPVRLLTP